MISEPYRKLQEELHEKGGYGVASIKYAPIVTEVINRLQVTHLLDYGCGKMMNLYKHIKPTAKLTYQAYDPGVPDLSGRPVPAQMVACIDVLEHIEPEHLEAVLDDLKALTEIVLFATVHTGPAGKFLSDGRNAHINQKPMSWWAPKFLERWDLQTVQVRDEKSFFIIGYTKGGTIEAPNGQKLVNGANH
jgi:hypothetical protein